MIRKLGWGGKPMSKTTRRIVVGVAILGLAIFATGCLAPDQYPQWDTTPLRDFWVEVKPWPGMDRDAIQDIAEQAALEFEQFGLTVDPSSPNVIEIRVVKDDVVGDGHGGVAYYDNPDNLYIILAEHELAYSAESIKITLMHELGHMVGRKGGHLEPPQVGIMSRIPTYIKGQGFSKDDKAFICMQLETTAGVCAQTPEGWTLP